MPHNALMIFTAEAPEELLAQGGSQAWVLDPRRARKCGFAICTQSRGNNEWGSAPGRHGTAFMVGKIAGIVPSQEEGRWLIRFSDYAEVNIPDTWPGFRNPINYTSLEEHGIDPASLTFRPMPNTEISAAGAVSLRKTDVKPLTIAQAKEGLAAKFGVSVDAIEITIRA